MARRRSRHPSTDEGISALVVALLLSLGGFARWMETLPGPWQVAASVFVASVVMLLGWMLFILIRRMQSRRLLQAELGSLTPTQFEERVKLLLSDLGWTNLQLRGGRGDRGVDLVGQYEGKRYIVQCKRYAKNVAPAMVRDLVGALHIQQADRALLITTSGFTTQGYAEARDQRVELWDGKVLAEQIARAATLRADPERQRVRRRRLMLFFYAIVFANSIATTYAFAATRVRPAAPSSVARGGNGAVLPTLMPARPPAAPPDQGESRVQELTPLINGAIFTSGAFYERPDAQAPALGQLQAGEVVSLVGQTPDRAWLQILDARGASGWVQRSMLQLDAGVEGQLPIVEP